MNIALIGYGAMGHEIEAAAHRRGHVITATFSSGSPLPPASSEFFRSTPVDCFIDFSSAGSVRTNAEICSTAGIPLVEGTTGWHDQRTEILTIVQKNNGKMIYGNNFSIGVQLFFRIVHEAARLMNAFHEYDAAIHEIHHLRKKDAPSGTAISLSNILLNQLERKNSVKKPSDASPIQPGELSVSSQRIGSVPGTHSVLFQSAADEIELIHRAHNRSGFASGAVLAAEMVRSVNGATSFEELMIEQFFTHSS